MRPCMSSNVACRAGRQATFAESGTQTMDAPPLLHPAPENPVPVPPSHLSSSQAPPGQQDPPLLVQSKRAAPARRHGTNPTMSLSPQKRSQTPCPSSNPLYPPPARPKSVYTRGRFEPKGLAVGAGRAAHGAVEGGRSAQNRKRHCWGKGLLARVRLEMSTPPAIWVPSPTLCFLFSRSLLSGMFLSRKLCPWASKTLCFEFSGRLLSGIFLSRKLCPWASKTLSRPCPLPSLAPHRPALLPLLIWLVNRLGEYRERTGVS